MKPRMPRSIVLLALWLLAAPSLLHAQESYKIEPAKASALPEGVPSVIAEELAAESLVINLPDGKPLAQIWLRKAVPARSAPSGPEGAVQFPFLVTGELLGLISYTEEAHDYRDQSILPGVYSIRFGLHPINGDHLGVSPFRDYALLVPIALEKAPTPLGIKDLERESAEAAGTNHPAVLLLTTVAEAKSNENPIHDEVKRFWGIALPVTFKVDDTPLAKPYPVGLIYDGVAAQ